MRKLIVLTGAAALGLGLQTAAHAYSATANVTFSWGGHTLENAFTDVAWTGNGANTITGVSNNTYFTTLGGYNSRSYYNSDFASASGCAAAIPGTATLTATRKYGCRYSTILGTPLATDVVDQGPPLVITPPYPKTDFGPRAGASGTLTVTDTTLTGTLTVFATSDEPAGSTTVLISGTNIGTGVGTGFDGYNYRSADGSPFGSVWYGVGVGFTLDVNLTGTFTSGSWQINGGTVAHSGFNQFACQQGGLGGADGRGTLCSASASGGGFQADGGHLDWGMDIDGRATGATAPSGIVVKDANNVTLDTLSGVLASLSISGGSITTNAGEFRRGSGSSQGCVSNIQYNGTKISCGTLAVGQLDITGSVSETVIPVPAAVWLMGSALGLLGWMRRKASA